MTKDYEQMEQLILIKILKLNTNFFINELMAQPPTQKWMSPFSKSFSNITNEYAINVTRINPKCLGILNVA